MAREIEGYRERLAELNELFPHQTWLSQSDVARYLGVDRRTVRRLIDNKKVTAYDVGVGDYKIYRIDKHELARALAGGKAR